MSEGGTITVMNIHFALTLGMTFLFVPSIVFGQGIVSCNGPDCNWSDIITLGHNILNFIVMLSIVASGIMFAYAGWLFFSDTGNSGNIEKGKKIFSSIVIGLVIVLVAWLVVNTILVSLTGKGLDDRVNEISLVPVDIPSVIV